MAHSNSKKVFTGTQNDYSEFSEIYKQNILSDRNEQNSNDKLLKIERKSFGKS